MSGDDTPRMLQPITGIKKTALMSLTEACRPLDTLIDDLDINVIAATDFAHNLLFNQKDPYGLTEDEIGAINLYTQDCIYGILNQRLREADRKAIQPFFPYLKLLLTAINKLPKKESTVWRGVKCDLSSDYKTGLRITWWAFSSCTLQVDVLEDETFLGTTEKRTLFSLHTKVGVEIQQYSMFKKEAEVLLPPGIRLEVTGVLKQKELQIVHLKELDGISVV